MYVSGSDGEIDATNAFTTNGASSA